jgi:hypothetical protein
MTRPPIAWLILYATLALTVAGSPACAQEAGASSAPAEMDLAQYKAALDDLSGSLERASAGAEAARALREALPNTWKVRVEKEHFEVQLDWVSKSLEEMEKNPGQSGGVKKQVQARLKLMREDADELERTARPPERSKARPALDKILEQSEFKSVAEPSWMDRMRDRFWAAVGRLLDRIFGQRSRGGTGRKILIWVLIGGAFLSVVWWARNALQLSVRTDSVRFQGRRAEKTWSEWAQEALRAAAKGDYRQAVHAAYWAGVFRLADLGAWELDRSRTPREYLRLLEEPKSLLREANPQEREGRAAALAKLTRNLESTWYGFEGATEVDFRDAVTQLEALGCRFPSNLAIAKS